LLFHRLPSPALFPYTTLFRSGSWDQGLEGEAWMLDGSRSVFGPEPWSDALAVRLQAFDIHPTAPLWGRGELRSEAAAAALEKARSEEHTSELQSRENLVCRLL